MPQVNARYTQEIRSALNYSATWLPSVGVRPGDVGIMSGFEYRRVASLKDFGIPFVVRKSAGQARIEHATAGAVSIDLGGAVHTPPGLVPLAKGSLRVAFSKADAVLFQASECKEFSIDDQRALAEAILQRHAANDWPDDYVVVTEVISAGLTTILISTGDEAHAEFSAAGALESGLTSLVDARMDIRLARSRNIGTQVLAEKNLTPLFRACGLFKPLLRRRTFGPTRGAAPPPLQFGAVDYDSFN
jgi:hypothetical protein